MRQAGADDLQPLSRLVQASPHVHLHADWRTPHDWLGNTGFLVCDQPQSALIGSLIAAADPPPAAWVRLAAMRGGNALPVLEKLLAAVRPKLAQQQIQELDWLVVDNWFSQRLEHLGFERVSQIDTYYTERFQAPAVAATRDVIIRPVDAADFDRLTAIEAAAFDPRWRHSRDSLQRGSHRAFSFTVAECDGRVIGFQYSVVQERRSGHLVRMTVDPAYHGRGIGSALLSDLFQAARRRDLVEMTLNTQVDNIASQRLYERFGFYKIGRNYPVWATFIEETP